MEQKQMTTAEELLTKIAAKFEKLGFTRRPSKLYHSSDYVTFFKPEKTRTYYYGTYLNPFSCGEWSERPGKIYLWNDAIANDEPTINLRTVYKHNGSREDTSVDIYVDYKHIASVDFFDHHKNDLKNKIFVRELTKSPKPITKVASPYSSSKIAFTSRLRKDATDRKIDNAVKKAIEAFDQFVPEVRTDEMDRADFPKDTSIEYFAQEEAFKQQHSSN